MPSIRLSLEDALQLARGCCLARGASAEVAQALATATVSAQGHGMASVGFTHLPDYLDSFVCGRIIADAQPLISHPAPALLSCDAQQGIAQLGFDRVFADLCKQARALGIALFAQSNAFTCGELGYYVRRLAEQGLLALAFTNGPPLLTVQGQCRPMYSTNPLALAALSADGRLLLIDQSSSATAFVNILQAAASGEAIPADWAVDASGQPTLSARDAVQGTLLAFGGGRGANIALLVEVLAAGLTGANWSLDAPDYRSGQHSPGAGLTVIAMAPQLLGEDFAERLGRQMSRLAQMGVHLPGQARQQAWKQAMRDGVELPAELYERLVGMLSNR